MIDLHVHTSLCRHARGEPQEYVDAARARGVGVMAFTDHLPLLHTDDTDYAMASAELPEYVSAISALRSSASPEILLGIEADWIPGHEEETAAVLRAHEFDIVLGSVHFIDDWAFDDPRLMHRYEEWDIEDLWARYFADLAHAAGSGLFDVMAHPDLVKKFGVRPKTEPVSLYEAAVSALSAAGVAVEISTAGLRKPVGEMYPSERFLAQCFAAGVPVTIGSDAHCPTEVGFAYDDAVALAQRVGYRTALVFRGRVPQEVSL